MNFESLFVLIIDFFVLISILYKILMTWNDKLYYFAKIFCFHLILFLSLKYLEPLVSLFFQHKVSFTNNFIIKIFKIFKIIT